MAESKIAPTIIVDGKNKHTGEEYQGHEYHASGFALTGQDSIPSFEPVEGGAEVTTRNSKTNKDETKFVPSGTVLTYENNDFKHVVTVK